MNRNYATIEIINNTAGANGLFTNVLFYTICDVGKDRVVHIVFSTTFLSQEELLSDDNKTTDFLDIKISKDECVQVASK